MSAVCLGHLEPWLMQSSERHLWAPAMALAFMPGINFFQRQLKAHWAWFNFSNLPWDMWQRDLGSMAWLLSYGVVSFSGAAQKIFRLVWSLFPISFIHQMYTSVADKDTILFYNLFFFFLNNPTELGKINKQRCLHLWEASRVLASSSAAVQFQQMVPVQASMCAARGQPFPGPAWCLKS